jgi:hypothetical protein
MAEVRPGQITSARMGRYADWAMAELRPDPMGQADPDLCRVSYLAWCSDRFAKPEPRSKQRAAVKAAGGRPVGIGKHLVYRGVTLAPPEGTSVPPDVLAASLIALRDAGLITPQQALDAAMRLA